MHTASLCFVTTNVDTYEGGKVRGVYNMAGNVWEWVADWYSETIQYSPSNLLDQTIPGALHEVAQNWQESFSNTNRVNLARLLPTSTWIRCVLKSAIET
jgi:formylglycine-generating enzyme required for sulfatase activity